MTAYQAEKFKAAAAFRGLKQISVPLVAYFFLSKTDGVSPGRDEHGAYLDMVGNAIRVRPLYRQDRQEFETIEEVIAFAEIVKDG